MSTVPLSIPSSEASSEAVATARPRAPGPGWLREPLLHFIAFGGLLFAADRIVVSRADDPHTIVVGPEVEHEAIETFKAIRNRDPNKEEL